MAPRERPHCDIIFQACYVDWLNQQLAFDIKDPFGFAYEATERELGRRQAWPAIHAATVSFFAGLIADVLSRWYDTGIELSPGHWVGSLPALIVGGLAYIALTIVERNWNVCLDKHITLAIESRENIVESS